MSETPEQIWINKIHGRHPEDWSFSVGAWETQSQLKEKVKYIRADHVDALLKAEREKALREAAAVARGIGGLPENTGSPPSDFNNEGYNLAANDAADTILALIENPAG